MKFINKIYHFLGSIYFALLLIGLVTLFVISGTFIESLTQSHRHAAYMTYDNPFFKVLLWGFFVNILLSALRRWPFKVRHIPFLTTHFGLLMILAGVLTKAYVGTQGTMIVMEGAASNRILVADTHTLQIDKPAKPSVTYNINELNQITNKNLSLHILDYLPSSSERLATWIQNDQIVIHGLKTLPVYDIKGSQESLPIPISGRVQLQKDHSVVWEIYGIKTDDLNKILNRLYRQGTFVKLTERKTGTTLAMVQLDLQSSLQKDIVLKDKVGVYGNAKIQLNLTFSDYKKNNLEDAFLTANIENLRNHQKYEIKVSLTDNEALLNKNITTPYLGNSPIAIDIYKAPMLILLEDQNNETFLTTFNSQGQVSSRSFGNHHLQNYIAYNEGYGGYTVPAELPSTESTLNREQRENINIEYLISQMRASISNKTQLSPPLVLFQNACNEANEDFVSTLMTFLRIWDAQHTWIYGADKQLPLSIQNALSHFDWQQHYKDACYWTVCFFDQIEKSSTSSHLLLNTLIERKWPLINECEMICRDHQKSESEKIESLMNLLTQQIFTAIDQLPSQKQLTSSSFNPDNEAKLLSAYLRAFGIHLSSITPELSELEIQKFANNSADKKLEMVPSITIETPLIALVEEAPIRKKWEDNIPAIKLSAKENNQTQTVNLSYDRTASGLKWPIFNGSYLLRFQPQILTIPYKIRLRQARQINYPNTQQALSYESDIVITDLRNEQIQERTISMNQVHETWDGYRFYLSNITPGDESAVKTIQITVNHDPAKYWLTYPGACILSLGIVLLFWMRPYRKQKNE